VELADVGCGAGLPGFVLAIALPELRVAAIESNRRKARFLELAAGDLGLSGRVHVVNRRSRELAHDTQHRRRYRIVTARAVAAADKLIADCRGLLAPGGVLAMYKTPPAIAAERDGARRQAGNHRLTLATGEVIDLPAGAGTRQFLLARAGG